jgi:phosphoglycerol transferase MdoB-like AlkP superfamily enzyme
MSIHNHHKPAAYRELIERIALPVLLAVAFMLLTGLMDGNPGVSPLQWYERPLHLFANALPGVLLALLLLVLTRRSWLSFGLAFLAQGVVYAVNAIKVGNLGSPLVPADFRMIGQLSGSGLHLLGSYLPSSPWPYLAIVAAVGIIVGLARLEKPMFPRRTSGKRLIAGLTVTALIGTLLAGAPIWTRLYDRQRLGMEPWSASATAGNNGLVTMLMQFRLQFGARQAKPDPSAARQFIAANDDALRTQVQAAARTADAQTPDIVIVQSESFFDPSIIKGYENQNFVPNLRRLAEHASSGALHVPTFGGGTIRTEFEVLTGLSLRYFADMQFPYLQMTSKVVPGMVRSLRSHGYETIAVHGNDGTFWNRDKAFNALGFDHFVAQPQFPRDAKTDGAYMADSAMTDEIMAQLKDSGAPRLVFAISMEAHGPYDGNAPIDTVARDAIPVPAGIDGKAKLELQTYIYHMRHADAELGRLADLLSHRERPTVLLFYGDHLPALIETYDKAGFVNSQPMTIQQVPWIMFDTRNSHAARADMAAWALPGMVLDRAGIHDDGYFALTQVLAPQLVALTRAPDAPQASELGQIKTDDDGLANVARLRFRGKLDKVMAPFGDLSQPAFAREPANTDTRAAAGATQ